MAPRTHTLVLMTIAQLSSSLATPMSMSSSNGGGEGMPPTPYAGYLLYPNQNVAGTVQLGTYTAAAGTPDPATAAVICDAVPSCLGFDESATGSFFKNFESTVGIHSYISKTTCGGAPAGVLEPASCLATPVAAGYWSCVGKEFGGGFTVIGTFTLPPFLIEQACATNPLCSAFTVNDAGTTGTIYSTVPATVATYSFNLKIPLKPAAGFDIELSESPVSKSENTSGESEGKDQRRRLQVTPPPPPPPPPPPVPTPSPFDGYQAFTTTNIALPLTSKVVFGPTVGTPLQYDAAAMSEYGMKMACATAGPAACSMFVNAPKPNPTLNASTWNIWAYAQDNTTITYLNTSVCVPGPFSCGASRAVYMKCTGRDTSAALVPMGTYDLPNYLVAQACAWKGCDAFVVKADNSTGTLYKFAVVPTTDSFVLLPGGAAATIPPSLA